MYGNPELLLEMASQRQAELRCESYRRSTPAGHRLDEHRFSGLHLHIGSIVVAIGRTICEEDAPRTRALQS